MDVRQQSFVTAFGNLATSSGFKRLHGLIIGLLLSSQSPLSLDEIAAHLNRSKGLMSETTRRLQSLGYIKKADGPVSRKDYYVADPDLFMSAFRDGIAAARRNAEMAQKFLDELEGVRTKEVVRWKENLRVMDVFYNRLIIHQSKFEQDWNELSRSSR
jgi:HTH-type transcriptional regulator, glycine betaine synthesis regulator